MSEYWTVTEATRKARYWKRRARHAERDRDAAENTLVRICYRHHLQKRRAKRWKKAAKYHRSGEKLWETGHLFLAREKWTPQMERAYTLPWWSMSNVNKQKLEPCIMCGDPFLHRRSNLCDACWQQEIGE